MRRPVSRRIFVIALMLARLMLGDLIHLSPAQAAIQDAAHPMAMMVGEPCSDMGGEAGSASTTQAEHPFPAHDGSCCKTGQCPCLHAPALLMTLQVPRWDSIGYADMPQPQFLRLNAPPAVFFRPPI